MESLKCPDVLLNSLENGHFVIDENFVVTYWNRWLSVNTQISSEDIIGKNLQEFYPDINYKILLRKIRTALRLKTPTFYDSNSNTVFIPITRNKVTRTALKLMQQQVTISPYIVNENKVMVSIYNISELHETKLSLQKEINKVNELNKILENDRDIIDKNIMVMKTSVNGNIIDVSTLFCEFFGYEKNELIGKNPSVLKSGKLPDLIYKELWNTITNNKSWTGEVENVTSSGESRWVQSRITPILDDDGVLMEFNAVYQDITNKKLLEVLYVTDPLTQIYNRTYFDELMTSIALHQRKADTNFIILITDIDHFKSINDTYGHQVGDEALKDVARVIKDSLRENDVVARWGGEEFVIMLKNTELDEAQMIAEKLRANIEKTKIQNVIDITTSIGLTKYYVGEDTNLTFKRADNALYKAKESGRNMVVTEL
ncbi:diguanylate cyclase (GGDEF domain) with PAS/PAC sensor [Sulfurimonas gotlandica GD1]|uniref:Diguanylate cyclase (GGDEF domain) with PAS/PAC sensor n=1 Tax=Sulfurimonas gotlandica (strain DSM 19862 / JCM 16533 / GD1) TaxID=929558 RepID=B6BGH7_SULGG|nr:diguanylate cyclase [Sulfurimonas gotlandica]EDZ63345.1 GGDEF domain/pas/pac sensor domain protein [Sulfurimonas gotlandica GD1]EHP29605.1 diguanylate cyclase (GGDEF domain) with PAS/PAC sensor [Sulfurimonas gotlandica GD1]